MRACRSSRCVGFILGVLISATCAFGQGTLFTLLTNAPAAKRINVVVLAEGYTIGQTNLFLTAASNAVNNLLAQSPYQEYKSYFNAYAIFVASAQSGSDHQPGGTNGPGATYRNTYFNSSFDDNGIPQLLTIPPNDFDATYANGEGKVDNLLAALFPQYDLKLMVVNDLEYGGSGGSTLISSIHTLAPEIVLHESGHTFGALTDEYDIPFPGYTPVEKPNATAITSSNSIKWKAWIPPGTLIPTPEVSSNYSRVGLFQGAQYNTTGWYRPKHDCKMNHLLVGFCEVCSEQLVKSIYSQVRPIDSFAPATTSLNIFSTQIVTFTVATLQPLTHNLAIQWLTNNVTVADSTNSVFTLDPKSLGNGAHTLKAVVRDTTALVRNDPFNLLRQTNTWNLFVSLNELTLVSGLPLAGNRFRFTVTGAAPQGFVIQGSTNLVNWSPLSTSSLSGGKLDFTNNGLMGVTQKFYRTVSPP